MRMSCEDVFNRQTARGNNEISNFAPLHPTLSTHEFSLFSHALCQLKTSSQLIRIGFVTRDAILCVLIEKRGLLGQKIRILARN